MVEGVLGLDLCVHEDFSQRLLRLLYSHSNAFISCSSLIIEVNRHAICRITRCRVLRWAMETVCHVGIWHTQS